MRNSHTDVSEYLAIPQIDGLNCSLNATNCSITDPNCSSTTVSNPTQEDSWFSQLDSSIRQEEIISPQKIPVHISPRFPKVNPHTTQHCRQLNPNNITIKRDNRLFEALSLPIFSVYNMRSIWSKLSSLAEDMDERNADLAILSEVWGKRRTQSTKQKLKNYLK